VGGFWARPTKSYADANNNGVIDVNEVQFADSMVYMGAQDPKYTMSWNNTVSMLDGRFAVSAHLTYQTGATQINNQLLENQSLSRAANVVGTPLPEQAVYSAMRWSTFGATQTISILRLQSVSMNYRLPRIAVRSLRAQTAVLMLQGENLGVRSNYTGLDANVSAFASEVDGIGDLGFVPPPRTWLLKLNLTY
jgi:hypothetical protein